MHRMCVDLTFTFGTNLQRSFRGLSMEK